VPDNIGNTAGRHGGPPNPDGNVVRPPGKAESEWEPKDPAAYLPKQRPKGVAGRGALERQDHVRRSGGGNGSR
jgi:hypothetical protein